MERLKAETWPLHQTAERAALEKDLVKGELPRDIYLEYLSQRYFIHRALETRLREAKHQDQRVAAVVKDHHFHEPRIAADLSYFGGAPDSSTPLPSSERLIASIQAADPVALLGYQYVLEGSTNGARYIAQAVRKAWDLTDGQGTSYLDPYGSSQREKWGDFKSTMNEQQFSDEESERMVTAAKEMFLQIIELTAEIYPNDSREAEQVTAI